VKKFVFAALMAASAASAQAAVTFSFAGAEFGGAAVSGTLTIDTSPLTGGNGAADPALDYLYILGDPASPIAAPFLSVTFSSAGAHPVLLSAGDSSFQWLQADPSDGSFGLELDWQVTNPDSTITSSMFQLSGFDLASTRLVGGVRLPDFKHAGTLFFDAQSGTGPSETYDVASSGMLSFGAVPEASTWSMLVLGFGAAGYALRRRPRLTIAA
jgi:hypothetical protein